MSDWKDIAAEFGAREGYPPSRVEEQRLCEEIARLRAMLNMKIDDWIGTCKEIDELRAEVASHERYRELVRSDLAEREWKKDNDRLRSELAAERKERDAAQAQVLGLREVLKEFLSHEFCECGCENCHECSRDSIVRISAGEALSTPAPDLAWVRTLVRSLEFLRDEMGYCSDENCGFDSSFPREALDATREDRERWGV